MGRHSAEPAETPQAAPEPERRLLSHPSEPITDPVLLSAIEEELRRLRHSLDVAATDGGVRRIETPFSGPVDVPVENAIGPDLAPQRAAPPITRLPPMRAPGAQPRTGPIAHTSRVAAPQDVAPPAPAPVSARLAAAQPLPAVLDVIAPHAPARRGSTPLAPGADPQEPRPRPVGASLRTLLLGTGIGVALVTALCLITLLPR